MIYFINLIVILIIAFLEYQAIIHHINSITFATSLFLIGLLTPSHEIILKFIKILKKGKNGA